MKEGIKMNIDWKSRITNKTFWVAIVSAIVLLTQQLGYNIFPSNWADILNTVLAIFILLGIIIDPSTKGFSDEVKQIVQVAENKQEVKEVKAESVVANNTTTKPIETSASSKITVDNPDNVQAIGNTVNHISANMPQ
jgi:phi LC3 family holin